MCIETNRRSLVTYLCQMMGGRNIACALQDISSSLSFLLDWDAVINSVKSTRKERINAFWSSRSYAS